MKKSTSQTLDTGSLLTAYCKKKRVHKAALARKMGMDYRAVFYYLKTNSMDLEKLLDFSHALNHNFLLDLAVQLPVSYTTDAPLDTSKDEENMRLKEQIKILEAEKEILLRAFARQ
jgi:hypothetical protein